MYVPNAEWSIPELLEQAAKKHPQVPAFSDGLQQYNFSQWHILTGNSGLQLESLLRKPQQRIGIFMKRCMEMLHAIYSIQVYGAAYVPADPEHPEQRIQQLFRDAEVHYVVTTPDFMDAVRRMGFEPVVLAINLTPNAYQSKTRAHHPAYVLFTSGSTGTPKGVEIAHGSISNLLKYMQDNYPLQTGDRLLFKSPYTFDGSVWEIYGGLINGSCVFVAPPGAEKEPALLWNLLVQESIHFIFFVPAMLQAFTAYVHTLEATGKETALKWVSVGGEILQWELIRQFYQIFNIHQTGLINVYGPTETTVYATTWLCDPTAAYPKVPIGSVVTGNRIYLFNSHMELVNGNEEAEIYIAGKGVGLGYLNNPELNQKHFLEDPFFPGEKMYRTGDTGKWLNDTLLDFTGRIDHQVKLRGLRIETGEIENRLLQIPEVREAVVMMEKDPNADDALVAYLRLNSAQPNTAAYLIPHEIEKQIQEQLRTFLPGFMIPGFFVAVPEFQLTAHGKIDRKKLPTGILVSSKPIPEASSIWVPRDETESFLYNLWTQLLGTTIPDANTDFFSMGGHSLKVVQTITAILARYGVPVSFATFFQMPTIRKLADYIHANTETNRKQQDIPKRLETVSEKLSEGPLTPVQEEMWIIHKMDPTGRQHNILIEFTIEGAFDPARLENSFNQLLQQIPSFNSSFPISQDAPIQLFQNTYPANGTQWHFWHSQDEKEKNNRYQKALELMQHTPLDPQKPPLYLVEGFHWSKGKTKVLFCIHHILFDGWSLQRMINFWKDLYAGHPIPYERLHPTPYAQWLSSRLNESQIQQELNWWKTNLPPVPPLLTLPRKINQQAAQRKRSGARYLFTIDCESTQQLHEWLNLNGFTAFVWFTSLYHWVLSIYSQQKHIHIGTPFAQRQHPDAADLIGYYTNMLILSLQRTEQESTIDFLNNTRSRYTEAIDHSLLPFGKLVRELNYRHPASTDFGFQTIIVLQNWSETALKQEAFTIHQSELGNGTSKTDLMLNIEPVENEYRCWFEYDTALFDASWIAEFTGTFQQLVAGFLSKPDQPLTEFLKAPRVRATPRCWLIGEGTISARSLELLEEHGAAVTAVISPDPILQEEARLRGICTYPAPQQIPEAMQADLLFSVNNPWILKSGFLKRISIKSINFHDSLLPDYAGLYATSWAILNQETKHGISWHEITDTIDGGTILSQQIVPVEPDCTVRDLNMRCLEQALKTLDENLQEWLHRRFNHQTAASLPVRYHSQQQRPFHWGWLHPNWDTESALQLFNACYFGVGLENPFLLPAIQIQNQLYFIHELPVRSSEKIQPGFIKKQENRFHIGLKNGSIQCNRLLNPTGAHETDLMKEDAVIPWQEPADADLANLTRLFRKYARHEKYWVDQLTQLNSIHLDASVFNRFQEYGHPAGSGTIQLDQFALFIYYLSRIYGYPQLPCCHLLDGADQTNGIHNWTPWIIQTEPQKTLDENIQAIQLSWQQHQKAGGFLSSVLNRYPSVTDLSSEQFPVYLYHSNTPPQSWSVQSKKTACIQIQNNQCILSGFPQSVINGFQWFAAQPETGQIRSQDLPLIPETDISTNHQEISDEDVLLKIWNQVKKNPDAPALTGSSTISYQLLWHYVEFRATELQKAGVVKGNRVAVPAINSPEYVITLLSLFYLNASFVPVDPAMPFMRQEIIQQQCRLMGFANWSNNPSEQLRLLNRIQLTQLNSIPTHSISEGAMTFPEINTSSEAYILFTSGSTGTPKGVCITRNNLNCFIHGALDRYPVTSTDRWLQFANLSFDTSMEELFVSLCSGASLFVPASKILEPDRLNKCIEEEQISVMDFPTGYWRQWIQEQKSQYLVRHQLKLIILGGEALLPDDVQFWQQIQPECTLINSYGPTECTVVALSATITHHQVSASRHVPIGKPLKGYWAKQTDSFGHALPAGIPGNLQLSGAAVTNGYLLQPEQVAIQNVPNQSSDLNRKVHSWYSTGDRVIQDPQHNYYFIGRTDQQVKIRGFRIEPEELRRLLMMHPQVQDVAILIQASSETEKELIAVLATHTAVDEPSFREQLLLPVPAWMKPSRMLSLAKFPLTANGKTDYKALQQIIQKQQQSQIEESANTPPIGPFEHSLHQIWSNLFKRSQINVTSDFFENGGHSLLAVRLMAQIKQAFQLELPLASLLSHGTIREQAQLIESRKIDHLWDLLVPIRPGGTKTPLFLIHGAGLNVLLYQSIAGYLDPQRPVYALQARGLDGKTAISTRIEEMATDYIREIRKVQPNGPYYLLGYSIGGFIVYEMAHQLLQQQETIGMAGVIDTIAGSGFERRSGFLGFLQKINHQIQKIKFNIQTILHQKGAGKKKLFLQKFRNFQVLFRFTLYKLNLLKEADLRKNSGKGHGYYMADAATIAMLQALNQYQLNSLPVTIDLFKAANSTIYVPDRNYYGWKRFAQNGVVVHTIPGDHADMFAPPNDRHFAFMLEQRLIELDRTLTDRSTNTLPNAT